MKGGEHNAEAADQASMRPRPKSRGNGTDDADQPAEGDASMRPRPKSRGNLAVDGQGEAVTRLQ